MARNNGKTAIVENPTPTVEPTTIDIDNGENVVVLEPIQSVEPTTEGEEPTDNTAVVQNETPKLRYIENFQNTTTLKTIPSIVLVKGKAVLPLNSQPGDFREYPCIGQVVLKINAGGVTLKMTLGELTETSFILDEDIVNQFIEYDIPTDILDKLVKEITKKWCLLSLVDSQAMKKHRDKQKADDVKALQEKLKKMTTK